MIAVIGFTEGMLKLADLSFTYLYKDDFNQTPVDVQNINSITSIPWILKPIWGLITDTVPIFGYRRKTYLILLGLSSFTFWILIGCCINNIILIIFA